MPRTELIEKALAGINTGDNSFADYLLTAFTGTEYFNYLYRLFLRAEYSRCGGVLKV